VSPSLRLCVDVFVVVVVASISIFVWSILFIQLLALTEPSLLRWLMEAPVRCLAQMAQVRANMWVRNGLKVWGPSAMYGLAYWSESMLGPDLVLLQCLSSLIPPDEFMTLLVQRFECANAFVFDPYLTNPSPVNPPMDKVAFYCLLTLINIVTPNSRLFWTDAQLLRHDLIQKLCIDDWSFSKICEQLSPRFVDHPELEKTLHDIATLDATRGVFVLKTSLWKEWFLYCPQYSDKDRSSAEMRYKALRNPPAYTLTPAVPAHLTPTVALVQTGLGSRLLHAIMYDFLLLCGSRL
jgi:hypothetical protein